MFSFWKKKTDATNNTESQPQYGEEKNGSAYSKPQAPAKIETALSSPKSEPDRDPPPMVGFR